MSFRKQNMLYVIPYNAPWYELLLSYVLMIKTLSGKFGVKTGSVPRKYRGWVGFYNAKGRVRREVVQRHKLDPQALNLGMLVGVGFLEESRELTNDETYQWYLRANKITDAVVVREAGDFLEDPGSTKEKASWCGGELFKFVGNQYIIAGPGRVGHFYRPDSLKRFSRPIPINYPSGPVLGTNLAMTAEIRKALKEIGVEL